MSLQTLFSLKMRRWMGCSMCWMAAALPCGSHRSARGTLGSSASGVLAPSEVTQHLRCGTLELGLRAADEGCRREDLSGGCTTCIGVEGIKKMRSIGGDGAYEPVGFSNCRRSYLQ
jgi:hypothetical protein